MAGAFAALTEGRSCPTRTHGTGSRRNPRPPTPAQLPAPEGRAAARDKPVRIAVAAVAGSALLVSAWLGSVHLMALAHHPAALNQADVLGMPSGAAYQDLISQRPASPRAHVTQQPKIVSVAVSRPGRPYYVNPLRGVSGLVPERIDEGVDFGGTGPVYALGDAIVASAGENAGWPGGGWITYRLTDGPDAGLMVYLAEDVTGAVQTGQHVTPSTVIANMFSGGDGIETGWAQPTSVSAESELPEAGGMGGSSPSPAGRLN